SVIARIDIDAGEVGFDSGNPTGWFFPVDIPLFHCDFYFDSESFDEGYAIRLREVAFEMEAVATEDLVVPAATPTVTPTATVTPTYTPTPLFPARRCEVTQPGVAIVCVEDVEAAAGDDIKIS